MGKTKETGTVKASNWRKPVGMAFPGLVVGTSIVRAKRVLL